MRRMLLLLPALVILLAGCGGGGSREKQAFLALRTRWLEAREVSLHAELRADYGERVYDYTLLYTGDEETGLLQVEAPKLIEGVEVLLDAGRVTLRCQDTLLDTGAVAGRYSPLQALPLQLHAWRKASVLDCWRESRDGADCLVADLDLTGAGEAETLRCRAWFDAESGEPRFSELSVDGRTTVSCRFFA